MRRLNIASPQFSYDENDPEGFRSGLARLGKILDPATPKPRASSAAPAASGTSTARFEHGLIND